MTRSRWLGGRVTVPLPCIIAIFFIIILGLGVLFVPALIPLLSMSAIDSDGDGIADIYDQFPFDPLNNSTLDDDTDDDTDDDDTDDDDEVPIEETWIMVSAYIYGEYEPSDPDIPLGVGNPAEVTVDIDYVIKHYYDAWRDGGCGGPYGFDYDWILTVHKMADGTQFAAESIWGDMMYDFTTDTWIYAVADQRGTAGAGSLSPVFQDSVNVTGMEGHYVYTDFEVTPQSYPWCSWYIIIEWVVPI